MGGPLPLARLAWLRRRLKLDPTPFAPIPPPGRASARWRRLLPELMLAEQAAAEELERFVAEMERHAIAGEEAARWLRKPKS